MHVFLGRSVGIQVVADFNDHSGGVTRIDDVEVGGSGGGHGSSRANARQLNGRIVGGDSTIRESTRGSSQSHAAGNTGGLDLTSASRGQVLDVDSRTVDLGTSRDAQGLVETGLVVATLVREGTTRGRVPADTVPLA